MMSVEDGPLCPALNTRSSNTRVSGELSHITNPIASQHLLIAIRRPRRAQYIAPVPSADACWQGLLIGDSERQRFWLAPGCPMLTRRQSPKPWRSNRSSH